MSGLENFLLYLLHETTFKSPELDAKTKEFIYGRLEIEIKRLTFRLRECESPIEQLFLVAFNNHWGAFEYRFASGSDPLIDRINIEPQKEIETDNGKYRVDFLISVQFSPEKQKPTKYIVVECDGHDFHEKTKKQAKRDKSRDRDLQSYGFTILRFTGSEIWSDPKGCAYEVFDLIEKMICEA